jgi:hypothetical protein
LRKSEEGRELDAEKEVTGVRLFALFARSSLIWIVVTIIFGAFFGCSTPRKRDVRASIGEMPVDSLYFTEALQFEHVADSAMSAAEDVSPESPAALAYSEHTVRHALQTHSGRKKLYATGDCGGFSVRILTPAYIEFMRSEERARHEAKLEKKRLKGKEIKPEEAEFKDPFGGLEYYLHHSDGRYKGLVTVWAEPKVGETKGSWFRNYVLKPIAQIKPPGQPFAARPPDVTVTTVQYKGSCQNISLLRNAEKTQCTEGRTIYRRLSLVADVPPLALAGLIKYEGTRADDFASAGLYQFDPALFSPDDGIYPDIVICISDNKKERKVDNLNLPGKVVQGIWEEFEALARANAASEPSE